MLYSAGGFENRTVKDVRGREMEGGRRRRKYEI
jgi:hypothetical protein